MGKYEVHVCDLCGHESKERDVEYNIFTLQNRMGSTEKKKSIYADICPMCEDVIRNTAEKLKEKEPKGDES